MNRNFYISDPDAFSVSTEVEPQQTWHNRRQPLSLEEADVQAVIAAVAGGMYDIGDDLPTLASTPDRLALVENKDLLSMVELRRAATPLDLMSFSAQDEMPSEYFLKEDARQSMLAVFNWTDGPRSHDLKLTDLGLAEGGSYQAFDALHGDAPVALEGGSISINQQPPHSVRLIKIINSSVPAAAPSVTLNAPASAGTGQAIKLQAIDAADGVPAISYHWDFGDGTSATGPAVSHTFTRAADYSVKLAVDGMDGLPADKQITVAVRGAVPTAFHLDQNRRYAGPAGK